MIIHNPILTGSFTVNGTDVSSITSSAASLTSLNSYTASQNNRNGTYATTGSNTFAGIQTVNSNLVVTGSITAQTLVVQTVTSSVVYSSGSNVFGNNIANTQVFTGSMNLTGSLTVVTTGTEFQVNSTGVNLGNALTDSHVISGSVRINPNGLFVSSSGLVGIGTTSPSFLLDLQRSSTGADVVLRVQNTAAGTINDASVLHLGWSSNLAGYSSIITDRGGRAGTSAAQGSLYFNANQDAVERIRMTIRGDSGNVGIGRTDPSFILDVSDANGSGGRGIRISTASTSVGPGLFLYGSSGLYTNWVVGTSYSTTNALEFVSSNSVGGNPSSAGTTRMLITNTGITQINGTNGAVRLTIQNTDNTGYLAFTEQDIRMWRPDGSGANLVIATQAITGTFGGAITFNPLNVERVRITGGGNVAIGNTTAAKPLSVWTAGGIGVYSNNSYSPSISLDFNSGTNIGHLLADQNAYYIRTLTSYPIYIQANAANGVYLSVGATSFTGNSDERLKNINSNIENALDKILTLRAVNFSWKSDETNKENLGLIAQDVEQVFPQVIDKIKLPSKVDEEQTDETEYLGVRYTELIPVLVKAIQELQAQINELKNK